MAFARPLSSGQIPVGCQLCDGGSKIQWKCCNCDVLMCTSCKGKVHSKFKNFSNHIIIDIKDVAQQGSEERIAFSNFNCQQHSDQPCRVFCSTCKKLICVKCITKMHNGHNLVDEDEYCKKRKNVRDKQTKIEANLNKFTKLKDEIIKVKKIECIKYDKCKNDILAKKKNIEKLVEELLNELDDKWKKVNQDLEEKQNEVDTIRKTLNEQKTTVDKFIKSEDFFNQERLLDVDVTQINTKYCSMPKFVSGDVTRDRIGTFKIVYTSVEQETKIEIKVARQFTSDLRCIQCTKICSDFSLWIGDMQSSLLQHIQINGNNKKELLRLNTAVWDMTVTPCDDLLICIPDESTLKQVSRTGEIHDTQYSVAPLIPTAVHVTRSNSVIIGAMNLGKPFPASGKRVVIVMDEKGNRVLECELDSDNKPIFTFPISITSTSEGNICAIDRLDSGMRGRVVVLGPCGNVLTTYAGRIDINNKIPFIPTDIITTNLNNIVVVDWNTDTIHILDSNGHFITYNKTKDFGIIRPFSGAVSTKGTIFIGCEAPNESQHTMKSTLYEVEFTGF